MSAYKVRTLILVAFWLLACYFDAGAYESVRNETRAFRVIPGAEIQISNKYGNVHIINWEKDSVRFEINLVVSSNKVDKAEKTMSEINFEFSATSHYVIAKTVFKNAQGSFIEEVSNLANTLFTSSNRVTIDYKVYLPYGSPLKIENKFGHIFMTDFSEKVNIQLSNGDLKANEILGDFNLKIDFGAASIRKMGDCKIEAGYADIEISQAASVRLNSRSSTLEFGTVGTLEINSRRDKINLKEIKSIKGDLSFSDLRIDNFSTIAMLNTNYGKVDLRTVAAKFEQINLTAKYTELSLNFGKTTGFKIDLVFNKQTSLANTLDFSNVVRETLDDKNGIYRSSGVVGQGRSLPEVSINISGGQISLTNF